MAPTAPPRPAASAVGNDLEDDVADSWRRLGDVIERVIAKIARKHSLPVPTARTVAELAGLGNAP